MKCSDEVSIVPEAISIITNLFCLCSVALSYYIFMSHKILNHSFAITASTFCWYHFFLPCSCFTFNKVSREPISQCYHVFVYIISGLASCTLSQYDLHSPRFCQVICIGSLLFYRYYTLLSLFSLFSLLVLWLHKSLLLSQISKYFFS